MDEQQEIENVKERIKELARYNNLRPGGFLTFQNITSVLKDAKYGKVVGGRELALAIEDLLDEDFFEIKNEDEFTYFLTEKGFQEL